MGIVTVDITDEIVDGTELTDIPLPTDESLVHIGIPIGEPPDQAKKTEKKDLWHFQSTKTQAVIAKEAKTATLEPRVQKDSLCPRVLIVYSCWLITGFLFGWHWLALICYGLKKKERYIAFSYFITYWLATIMAVSGGVYLWVEGNVPCPEAMMTRECLYTDQSITYQALFTMAVIGLSILAVLFLLDGTQLYGWIRAQHQGDWLRLWATPSTTIIGWVYPLFISITLLFVVLTWTVFVNWSSANPAGIIAGLLGGILGSSLVYWGLVQIPIFQLAQQDPDPFEKYRDIERRVKDQMKTASVIEWRRSNSELSMSPQKSRSFKSRSGSFLSNGGSAPRKSRSFLEWRRTNSNLSSLPEAKVEEDLKRPVVLGRCSITEALQRMEALEILEAEKEAREKEATKLREAKRKNMSIIEWNRSYSNVSEKPGSIRRSRSFISFRPSDDSSPMSVMWKASSLKSSRSDLSQLELEERTPSLGSGSSPNDNPPFVKPRPRKQVSVEWQDDPSPRLVASDTSPEESSGSSTGILKNISTKRSKMQIKKMKSVEWLNESDPSPRLVASESSPEESSA